jgi:hypothetical protein
MSERAAIFEANRRYSQTFGEKGALPLPPARRIAILTCMDARLDPAAYTGLQEGDAHVIRTDEGEGPGSSALFAELVLIPAEERSGAEPIAAREPSIVLARS